MVARTSAAARPQPLRSEPDVPDAYGVAKVTKHHQQQRANGEVVWMPAGVAATHGTPSTGAPNARDDVVARPAFDGKSVARLAEECVAVEGDVCVVELEIAQPLGTAKHSELVSASELELSDGGAQDQLHVRM